MCFLYFHDYTSWGKPETYIKKVKYFPIGPNKEEDVFGLRQFRQCRKCGSRDVRFLNEANN